MYYQQLKRTRLGCCCLDWWFQSQGNSIEVDMAMQTFKAEAQAAGYSLTQSSLFLPFSARRQNKKHY